MSAPPPITLAATELATAIRAREVASADVVEAHIELIERREPLVNAIAVRCYDRAREQARAADERIAAAAPGEPLPPLLGVPITIKESIGVDGLPNTSGVVAHRERLAPRTAPAAARLLDAGAVLLGLTNLSELTMWIESQNRVYGRTNNAYDRSRIAGGSSGGEGAAVGSGYSPIGLGSDIAGSIRLPAFFNGVFGHKPSPGLVPNSGQFPVTEGEAGRLLGVGPITRRAVDLMPALSLIAGPDGEDPLTREAVLGDPAAVDLRGLAVIVSEGGTYLPVSRDLLVARERAAGALAAAGARIRSESLRGMRRATELFLAALAEGAGTTAGAQMVAAGAAPLTLRASLRNRSHHTIPTHLLLAGESLNRYMPRARNRRVLAAAAALARELADVVGDGVILHPPHARVAPRHGRTVGRPWVVGPTAAFNVAGLPVTQVPLGLDRRGLPLGVQVAAGPDRDHVAIAVALELERVFGGWVPPWTVSA